MPTRDVLLVSSNLPPVVGGAAVVYDQLCRSLPDRIVALGPKRRYETGEPLADLAVLDAEAPYLRHRIDLLRPVPGPGGSGARHKLKGLILSDLPVMIRLLWAVVGLCVRYRIRTVCIGDLVANGWLVYPLRFLLGLRVVIYTHGEEVLQTNASLQGRLRGHFLRHASAVVSVSLFCKGTIVSEFKIPPDRIFVVPNGVDLDTFHSGPALPALLPPGFSGKRILLSVSRLVKRKGQAQLIDALPTIIARVPDIRCLIAGTGPEAEPLERRIAALGLQNYVAFLGSVEQPRLAALYRTAELFVLPCQTLDDGDTEGFGLVFLEANACGLPVVGGAAGGTVEAIMDGETGLIVNGTLPAEIADAVLALLEDGALARRLGEQGRRRAQASGWAGVAANFLKVCKGEVRAESPVLEARPAAGIQAIEPPDDAGPSLLVTVDVEEQFDWAEFSRTTYRVDGAAQLAEFVEGCAAYGVAPVLLATHPMLAHDGYRELFRDLHARGMAEIGIHLHGWTAPPHWEHVSAFNSYQCNLPHHIEARKLERLCGFYEDRLGIRPRIHRAGRWGGSARTFDIIERLGIEIDLSLSAGLDDRQAGGPDFTQLDGTPLWLGTGRRVLGIPATSIEYLRGPQWISDTHFAGLRDGSKPRRALTSWIADGTSWIPRTPIRFTPEGLDSEFLKRMAVELHARQTAVAVFTLHGTSLYAGGSPYARTAPEATEMARRAIDTIAFCVQNLGYRPARCAHLYSAAKAAKDAVRAAAE